MRGQRHSVIRAIGHDERGATLIEFAFVAPTFCLMLVGAFDIGHTLYMRSILQGVVQKAARDSALENGPTSQNTIDTRVRDSVHSLNRNANVTITRRFYRSFSEAEAAQAEAFTDTNGNGTCDASEPYEDVNNNNVWDEDGADDGQGGAKDSVVYTVNVTYERIMPLSKIIPHYSDQVNVEAATVLSNQPYGDQNQYAAPTLRNCPA